MNVEQQNKFEEWYNSEFAWYIERGRRGYCLKKQDDDTYFWEHPRNLWTAWQAAVKMNK